MEIIAKKLTLEEAKVYIRDYDFGTIPPDRLVIHHTWKPRKEDWNGLVTIKGLKNYYEGLGWSVGPHLFIAEDGIWLFTPMREVGIHAGKGNSGGSMRNGTFWYSIGIEVVGDYDTEVWSGETKKNTLGTISALMKRLKLENNDIRFHREYSSKTCPGAAITKDWLFKELEVYNKGVDQGVPVAPWAQLAWDWAQGLGLDRTVHPQQTVSAQWVFAILFKLISIYGLKPKKK